MKLIQYDFSNLEYLKLEKMAYYPVDPDDSTIAINAIVPIELEKITINTVEISKSFMLYDNIVKFNYSTSTWEAISDLINIIGHYLVGNDGTSRNADNLYRKLPVLGTITSGVYTFLLINEISYVESYFVPANVGGYDNQWRKDIGENKYWTAWAYVTPSLGTPYYENIGVAYACLDYYFSQIINTDKLQLQANYILYNNDKTTPLYFEKLEFYKLPAEFSLENISVDYTIDTETDNNFIGIRIVDNQDREWVYSTTNARWEYIGQAGGEFSLGSDEYTDITKINSYLEYFDDTGIDSIRLKFKVVSDDNDIIIKRALVLYNDLTDNMFSTVKIYGNIKDIIGVAQADVVLTFAAKVPQVSIGNSSVMSSLGKVVYTDINGDFEVDVIPNSEVDVYIPIAGIRTRVSVHYDDIDLVDYLSSIY